MVRHIAASLLVAGLVTGVGYYLYSQASTETLCGICHRAVHTETAYRIHLKGGRTVDVCCPRCGLRFQEGRDDVLSAEAVDFNTRERLDARKAIYVENSSVHLCCRDLRERDLSGVEYDLKWDRCLPSLVAFKTREAAEAFRSDNEGILRTYNELLRKEP